MPTIKLKSKVLLKVYPPSKTSSAKPAKRVKRKSKRKYKTGFHKSKKCPFVIKYRSGWEKIVCEYLDFDLTVLRYEYESLQILYLANERRGKYRTYYPDFLIHYTDGTCKLVEVKRADKLSDPKVIKKAKAAEEWVKKQKMVKITYEIWTDQKIEEMRKCNLGRLKRKK